MLEGSVVMFVVFKDSEAIAAFDNQSDAVNYWRSHGGTIVLYPDLEPDNVFIR